MNDFRAMRVSAEWRAFSLNGFLAILLFIAAVGVALTAGGPGQGSQIQFWGGSLYISGSILNIITVMILLIAFHIVFSFYTLQPNEAMVFTFFGSYAGTDRTPGLRCTFLWYGKRKISLRAHNITSDKLKVNDKSGNPVEIAVNVVWRVDDTAKALFDVENYAGFIGIQIDTGLREIASRYAYDSRMEKEVTLLRNGDLVTQQLKAELQSHLSLAGVAVEEARLTHLAYAPEIAGVMLRRQQAEAVLAARQIIIEGAVKLVEGALQALGEDKVVDLDAAQRATLVSNLLVILCADREISPVIDASAGKKS